MLGVLGNGGGRLIREPDCSPLAAAPSLIRLQFTVNFATLFRLIVFAEPLSRSTRAPPGVGRISVDATPTRLGAFDLGSASR